MSANMTIYPGLLPFLAHDTRQSHKLSRLWGRHLTSCCMFLLLHLSEHDVKLTSPRRGIIKTLVLLRSSFRFCISVNDEGGNNYSCLSLQQRSMSNYRRWNPVNVSRIRHGQGSSAGLLVPRTIAYVPPSDAVLRSLLPQTPTRETLH